MKKQLAALALSVSAGSAFAFTPESGVWWNPAEGGRGFVIEVQDNVLSIGAYVYDTSGRAQWFTSGGTMTSNALYQGTLDLYSNGQAIGGVYRAPSVVRGAGGNVRIDFITETTARMTWAGGVTSIERVNLLGTNEQRMLGEWQTVMDFSTAGTAQYPFIGDTLVLRQVVDRPGSEPDQFTGCRADNALAAACSTAALRDHDVAGYFEPVRRSGIPTQLGNSYHVIVVNDSAANFLSYFVNVGGDSFEGFVALYPKNSLPTRFYPVRGFRTASRARVVTGVGPDGGDVTDKSTSLPRSVSAQVPTSALATGGIDRAAFEAKTGLDLNAMAPKLAKLRAP
jgi:hypothetical protein